MDILLSGLAGALIATVLTIIYLYVAEQSKLRSEVLLSVVEYCDGIYDNLQEMHAQKDGEYTHDKTALSQDEYRQVSRELSRALKSSVPHAKLAIIYGEARELNSLNQLTCKFREVARVLRKSTRANWVRENEEVKDLFEKQIDPIRERLVRELIDGTKAIGILKRLAGGQGRTI